MYSPLAPARPRSPPPVTRNRQGNVANLRSRNNRKRGNDPSNSEGTRRRRVDGEETEHAVKIRKQAQEWESRRDSNGIRYQESASYRYELREQLEGRVSEFYREAMVRALERERLNHPCYHSGTHNVTQFSTVKKRIIVVHNFGHRFLLEVPTFRCSRCNECFTVHPFDVDCAATSPTDECETWIPLQNIHLFEDLHMSNGLSADAYCHALTNLEQQYKPGGCDLVDTAGNKVTAGPLKSSQLITATLEFGKIDNEKLNYEPISLDPLQHCLICAETEKGLLNNGRTVPDAKVAICTDGMNGLNRFESAGEAQKDLKPSTKLYLGNPALRILQNRNNEDQEREDRQVAERAAEAALAANGENIASVIPACTSALSCNREHSHLNRAEMDICGVVSIVCAHNIPALRTTIGMTAPENHSFYDAAFREFFRFRSSGIDAIYLDLMCRYSARLKLLIDDMVEGDATLAPLREVDMLLPWMHAFDHDLSCQLDFSGLYRLGAGRRVGEQTESWWAELKPWAKIARYMSRKNWWDGLNRLYLLHTRHKQRKFPAVMASKIKRISAKRLSLGSELEALEKEAAEHGVGDCGAAMAFLIQAEQGHQGSLSLKAQYVEALLHLKSQEGLLRHKAVFPLQLAGNTGIHLHKKANDAATKRRLETLVSKLEIQLNILPTETWEPTSTEYCEGLEELRTDVLSRYQKLTELQVFKRKQIILQKQRNTSGKNAKKDEKRLQRATTYIKDLLDVMATWRVYNTDALPVRVTNEDLQRVLDGDYPWRQQEVGENGSESAQKHYGMRYRTALNQLKRTEEEEVILRAEVIRLVNRLEELVAFADDEIQQCSSNLASLQEREGHRGLGAELEAENASEVSTEVVRPSPESRRFEGMLVLLKAQKERFNIVLSDALNRFSAIVSSNS